MRTIHGGVIALCALLAASPLQARDLVIGSKLDPSSLDPHYFNSADTVHPQTHVFERLIDLDREGALTPGLALSWKSIDPLTWEFKLRPGVTFHNGAPFTAHDVAFTFERIPTVKSPGPFTGYTKQVTGLEIVDDLTLRMRTAAPHPFLPIDLTVVFIVSRTTGMEATTADYNTGKAAIGTGPYRLVQFSPGDRVIFEAVPNHWSGRQPWNRVIFRTIKNDAARVAALLAGDVELIDLLPLNSLSTLKSNARVALFQRPAARVMYVQMDSDRDVSPHAAGPDGRNPLKDRRVRKALSLAIDRNLLVSNVLEGAGAPASQMASPGTPGFSSKLQVDRYDPAAARRLLAEAGYPNGFKLTIHGTSDRYPNGDKVAQALAQFYTRIGVETQVALVPNAVFFPQASRLEYSFFFAGYGSVDPSVYLRTVLHSFDQAKALGSSNRGRYANPRVDALVQQALVTLDDTRRNALMAEAFELAEGEDQAVISVYWPTYDFAGQKDKVVFTPDANGTMSALWAKPAR
jgi:peptide/nickel transport system substrate-binding protein